MLKFMIAGGWSMAWLLILGLPLLGISAVFMVRANPKRLAILRALSAAVVFAALAGMAHDLIAVAWTVTGVEELRSSPELPQMVIEGIGEALTPAAVGFTLLSLAWLFVAIGMRRVQELSE